MLKIVVMRETLTLPPTASLKWLFIIESYVVYKKQLHFMKKVVGILQIITLWLRILNWCWNTAIPQYRSLRNTAIVNVWYHLLPV